MKEGKNYCLVTICALLLLIGCTDKKQPVSSLKEALKDKFHIGGL